MKTWTAMNDEERAAAAKKGDAVLLMRPVEPLRSYRDVAHALTDAVVDCPLGYHDGRPIVHRATTDDDVVAWLQRLARISEAVEAIDVAAPQAAFSAFADLTKWRNWAMRLLGCSEAYRGDDEELRNQINAAPEPPSADADQLRRETPRPPIGPWMSDVVAVLRSPEGRAAIAECMHRPPVRMADGSWREPTPGSEAKPGDLVRHIASGRTWHVGRVEGGCICTLGGHVLCEADAVEVIKPGEQGDADSAVDESPARSAP